MSRKYMLIGLIAIALVVIAVFESVPAPPQTYNEIFQFTNYIQSGLPEQDVFVEPGDLLDELHPSVIPTLEPCTPFVQRALAFLGPCATRVDVVRPVPQDAENQTFLAKRVYAVSKALTHDPYRKGKNPLGPFHKGDALDLTWGEWLAARGSGIYTYTDGLAELNLSFSDLIPNATYSLRCGHETSPLKNSTIAVPCNSTDELLSQFHTDEEGGARFSLHLKASLPANKQATTILSVEYLRIRAAPNQDHDGHGLNKHVQLWFPFP